MSMLRFPVAITIVLVALLSSGCASLFEGFQTSVENKVQQMLTGKFSKLFTDGIDAVISELTTEGGFLDDPVVRILLPPPLGLVLAVARDLHNNSENPQAVLLESLLNHAAEDAIPVAGPLLKDMIVNMDTAALQEMLDSPEAATTDYLKEKGGEAVKAAILPVVTKRLEANGAIQLYGKLLEAQQAAAAATQPVAVPSDAATPAPSATAQATNDTAQPAAPATSTAATQAETTAALPAEAAAAVTPEQLPAYVAEQAVNGLFKKVAAKEMAIRDQVNSTVEVPF